VTVVEVLPTTDTHTVGVATVTVVRVIPRQEHALWYLTVPAQGEAYAGTELGTAVICRRAMSVMSAEEGLGIRSSSSTSRAFRVFAGNVYSITVVTVWVLVPITIDVVKVVTVCVIEVVALDVATELVVVDVLEKHMSNEPKQAIILGYLHSFWRDGHSLKTATICPGSRDEGSSKSCPAHSAGAVVCITCLCRCRSKESGKSGNEGKKPHDDYSEK